MGRRAPAAAAPIEIAEPDPAWPARYEELRRGSVTRSVTGVVALDHVGSTSVPGLPAKPIIDIDLTVADSRDEAAYVPALEAAGFELQIREPGWHEHRCFAATCRRGATCTSGARTARRRSATGCSATGCASHPDDRARYAAAKRRRPTRRTPPAREMMAYNARKEPVLREILDRVFRAHGLA